MKKLNLMLAVLTLCLFYGCANEGDIDAVTGGGEGILGSVTSRSAPKKMDKVAVKTEPVKVKPTRVKQLKARPVKAAPVKKPSSIELMVADFNSGMRPCNVGGDFGAWDRDPADSSQTCTESFDTVNKYGRTGFGIKLEYDVDSSNPAYNGFWLKLKGLDASDFSNLIFFVKGDAEAGFTNVFKIELKNAKGEVGKFYVSGLTSDWREIFIPLKDFHGINSFEDLSEFVIVFEDRMATDKDGIIYIDEIKFTD